MTDPTFERPVKTSRLGMTALDRGDNFVADRSIRLTRPDRERLEGKVKKSRGTFGGGSGAGKFAKALAQRTKTRPKHPSKLTKAGSGTGAFDRRQRAMVKVHYFNHAGGGGRSLRAHAK